MLLSPSMAKLLTELDSLSWAHVNYKHNTSCTELVRHLCVNQLIKGKKVLLVVGDNSYATKLNQEFQKVGLDNLFLNLTNQDGRIDSNYLNLEKILRHKQCETIDLSYLNIIQKKTLKSYKNLKSSYSKLGQSIFDKTDWQQLVDFKGLMDRSDWNNPLNNRIDEFPFQWSLDEYLDLSKKLKYKAYSYKLHFNSLILVDPYSSTFYRKTESDKEIDVWLDELSDFITKMKSIRIQISDINQRQLSLAYADISLKNNELKSLISSLHSNLLTLEYLQNKNVKVQSNNILFSFETHPIDKDILGITEKIKDNVIGINILHGKEEIIIEENIDISSMLDQLEHLLVSGQNKMTLETAENETSLDVGAFIEKIDAISEEINSKNLLLKHFKCNARTADSLVEHAEVIIQHLLFCNNFILNNDDYVQWKLLLEKEDENLKQLVHKMISFDPEDWENLFENWYLLRLVTNNHSHSFPEEYDLGEYHNALDLESKVLLDYLQYYWKNQMLWANKTFSDYQQELKTLLKSTAKSVNLEIALNSWGKLISNYYPIIVIPEKNLINSEEFLSNWDVIVNLDTTNTLIPNVSFRQYFVHAITMKNIKDDAYILSEYGNQLSYVNEDEYLKQTKYLSRELIKIQIPSKVYANKDQLLISYWTDAKNSLLEQYIYESNYREVNVSEYNEETMCDLIVSAKKNVSILLQDGLLDLNSSNKKWQVQFCLVLENFGVNIINIWSKEYFIYGRDLIDALLVQDILDKPKPVQANPTQITLKQEPNSV